MGVVAKGTLGIRFCRHILTPSGAEQIMKSKRCEEKKALKLYDVFDGMHSYLGSLT